MQLGTSFFSWEAWSACRSLEENITRVAQRPSAQKIRDSILEQIRKGGTLTGSILLEGAFGAAGFYSTKDGRLTLGFSIVRRGWSSTPFTFPAFIAGALSAGQTILSERPDLKEVWFLAEEVYEGTKIHQLLVDLGFETFVVTGEKGNRREVTLRRVFAPK